MRTPQVTFHFNVADPVDYACRLVRKVRAMGLNLAVCADPGDIDSIDQGLWLLPQPLFLAHSGAQSPKWVTDRSPVRLCTDMADAAPAHVLVNLRAPLPAHAGRFERVVEIVPLDESARAAARQRWKAYAAEGILPQRHDAAAPTAH